MKVAIVHDYIKEYGGAERVLEDLVKVFPDATVFTCLYLPKFLGPHAQRFKKLTVKTSFFQNIPFKEKLISPLRILSPFAFKSFDFSGFDIIIVSQTGAYFPNTIRKKKAVHVTYTHTPPRYLYGYATSREWKKNPLMRVFGEVANHFLRMVDYYASKNVDYFICNSYETKSRIKKFYREEAMVIYPPVDIKPSKAAKKEDFYLAGGRLARAKGMDVIVRAFAENGKPLKIFGKGFSGYGQELVSMSKTNIEFLGEVDDMEKLKLMGEAKAFVFASYDEDFGITPVEAMGQGTPVIAFKSGGVKETVVEEKTGVFYSPNTPEALNSSIKKLEKHKISSSNCIAQAKKFSSARFKTEIKEFVNSVIKK